MAKKVITIRVMESCTGNYFLLGLFSGNKQIMCVNDIWKRKSAAIRNAKKLAKTLDIPYSSKIRKLPG